MEILNISKNDLENIDSINSSEAKLYYISNDKLLKIYNSNDEKYLNNKENNIYNLIEFNKKEKIEELVIPKGIVNIDNKFSGEILDRIYGKNISYYLNSDKIDINIKLKILKQVGIILEKIKNSNPKFNNAYSDVHSDNFMLSNDKVYGIDTTSMKIYDIEGNINHYLYELNNKNIEKYDTNIYGIIKSNYNTDIYCYIMMILEVIFKYHKIYTYDIYEYYEIIDLLDKIGINSDLLNCFIKIYDNKSDNINPLPYLDNIKGEVYGRVKYKI